MRTRALSALEHASIQEQVIDLGLAKSLERLLCEGPDISQIGKFKGKESQVVLGGVVLQFIVGCLGPLRVPNA